MYEAFTYSFILQRMLHRVSDDVDKREGSVIYDALAPAAAELSEMYAQLDANQVLLFADTAAGEWLERRTAEFGVERQPATFAQRQGEFFGSNGQLVDVPLQSRFAIDDLRYTVTGKIGTGHFTLTCETAGILGNQKYGAMLPLAYVDGLVRAELAQILVPGEEAETDEALRARYYSVVNEPAFGGNIADYKQMISSIDGVGGAKIFPVWNGGGTVKCTVIAADWTKPAEPLIALVQTAIDPTINSGLGLGMAPIGHEVTVTGVDTAQVAVETTVMLAHGRTIGQVQSDIEDKISTYLLELRQEWMNQQELTVRIAQIEARILTVSGVVDVLGTTLNGAAANLALAEDEIPLLGTVVVHD
ncbi:baseplate J/gp47 family protein [Paenibacillus sp. FSL H8-0537]|uniref:baseplate J/gp47 family protein n=1 Tax=Paenibacillus sp. FSL H8-0537 TaxID=2921399 RepID=UPI003101535B